MNLKNLLRSHSFFVKPRGFFFFFWSGCDFASQSNVLNMKYNHEEFIQQISIIHGHGVKPALRQ